jgi:hypothetical protein
VSAAAEHHTSSPAETCREAARALAPCSRCDGGLTISGSTAAALAELFRLLAREGGDGSGVPDVAARAARRLLGDAQGDPSVPAPRASAQGSGTTLASR